jgi:transposase InsO family protein
VKTSGSRTGFLERRDSPRGDNPTNRPKVDWRKGQAPLQRAVHWKYGTPATGECQRLFEPGKTILNTYVESLNGRLLHECLNEHWFMSVAHARAIIETWRREYNEE